MWTHHAQVPPVFIFADDVPHAGEGGAGVLVDCDFLIGGGRFTLTWNTCMLLTSKEHQQTFKSRFRAETSRLMADFRNKSHCCVILWLDSKTKCNLTASYYYATWNSLSFDGVSSLNPWSCKCALTCTFLQDDDHTFTISGRLDANGLAVNETIEAESIPGLQVIWLLKEEIRKQWLFNMQQNKQKKKVRNF